MATSNPAQRIKGQEVSIIINRGGVPETTLVDIQNFNAEALIELKSMGYLGEPTNRTDDIYNGCKFDFEMHIHTADYFSFQQAMIDRSKRVTPDIMFNITAQFNFPNGDTQSVLLQDAHFGGLPISIASRGDYVKIKVEGQCNDVITTAA